MYDRIGGAQDWQRFYEDVATSELVRHAGFEAAQAVVELGCGTGRFAAALLARHLPGGATYLGVDVSPRMVASTAERLRPWSDRASVALVDGGGGLPATDGSADRFVANYVFDLLSREGTDAALAAARRVLVPGGLLCATGLTSADGGVAGFVSRAWSAVWARWPALMGGCRPVRLADALEPAGWEVRHRRLVVAWGIASEAVIAVRR